MHGGIDNGHDVFRDPEDVSQRDLMREADEEARLRDRAEPLEITDDLEPGVFLDEVDEEVGEEELEAIGNRYVNPILVERIADRAGRILAEEGLSEAERLDGERYVALCRSLGQSPASDHSVAAIAELLLKIYEIDYIRRNLGDPITVEDLEEESDRYESDEFEIEMRQRTEEAYKTAAILIDDPILELPELLSSRRVNEENTKKLKWHLNIARERQRRSDDVAQFNFYDQKIEEIKEKIQKHEARREALESRIGKLVHIDEVRQRRERALRRFVWLIEQDFMRGAKEQLEEMKAAGEGLSFADAVRLVIDGIDSITETHLNEGLDVSTWTAKERRRYDVTTARYAQAAAICRNVFTEDLEDRIYEEVPIQPKDYRTLRFLRKRLYEDGYTRHLDNIVSLLPAGSSRNAADYLADEPLIKFGGRTKNQLVLDIDSAVTDDPDIEEDRVIALMRKQRKGRELTEAERLELAEYGLMVAEKLAFKFGYALDMLV